MSDKEVTPSTQPVGITMDQLTALIKTIQNPGKSDAQLADEQATRAGNAEIIRRERENKLLQQKYCSHRAPNQVTRFVHVHGNNLGTYEFFICQGCQLIVNQHTDLEHFNRLTAAEFSRQ